MHLHRCADFEDACISFILLRPVHLITSSWWIYNWTLWLHPLLVGNKGNLTTKYWFYARASFYSIVCVIYTHLGQHFIFINASVIAVDFQCITNNTVQVFLCFWLCFHEYHKADSIKNLKLSSSLKLVSEVRIPDLIFSNQDDSFSVSLNNCFCHIRLASGIFLSFHIVMQNNNTQLS